jgi:predicted amidohydrolase
VSRPFTAACIQLTAGPDLAPNIAAAAERIRAAHAMGAELVLTPENTTMIEPRRPLLLEKALPEARHPAIPAFAELAAELGIWLLIGSLAIKVEAARCANRSYLFDPTGRVAARYDKIHMFDVDLASGERYRESASFRPGSAAIMADLPWGRLGLTICYDLRFPALYRALARAGADFISVPSAFTRPTGEAHWQVLLRARAIETGCYILAPAQCGEHAEGRKTWGHSLIVSPWGEIVAEAGEEPAILTARIDPAAVAAARRMVPALTHDRTLPSPVAAETLRRAGE